MEIQRSLFEELANKGILEQAKKYAFEYLADEVNADVYPCDAAIEGLQEFTEPLPEIPTSAEEVLEQLHRAGSQGAVRHTGGKYFGFIIGGATPVSIATKWMTDVWDQCGGLFVSSPVNAIIESVCERWMVELLGLPENTVAGFVSGGSMANFSALAAARYHLFRKLHWDVNKKGLQGAPHIRLITHKQIHASIRKNLVLLGFGDEQIEYVPSDSQGRIQTDQLPEFDERCIVFLQAGNANTGSFDDFETVCNLAQKADAWVHIDGAFGLWAAATSSLRHLTKGIEKADSWAVDAHKTLNVPYDSGIVLCKHSDAMVNALQATGDYIIYSQERRDPMMFTPEMSKRSRAFELWATIKRLGKTGINEMITGFHSHATQFKESLNSLGYEVLNDVVFNQVLVRLGSDEQTDAALQFIQQSGSCWLGGTRWQERSAIRISVSGWQTTASDIEDTIEIFRTAMTHASEK